MKGRARCWSCVTLGLLVSGLIHAAAAGWWLRGWSPQAGPPATPPEAQIVELALAVFDEPLVQTLSEPTTTPAASPEPERIALAPEPEPPQAPEPEPPSPPAEEAPEPPRPEPPNEPEITPEPELQPPAPTQTEAPVKPPETRPTPPPTRPKKALQRQPPRPEKPARPKTADPRPPKRVEVGEGRPKAPPSAPQASPSGAGSMSRAQAERAIARHQRFPDEARKRGKTGVATLSFVVQGDGGIRQVRVAKSSGDASLDQAAVQAMQRLSRFKPIPAVIGRQEWAMRVPIRFDLR